MPDPTLRRFWIEFADGLDPYRHSYGVTAVDLEDALGLIERFERSSSFGETLPCPPPQRVVEDVDVSTLDIGHVIPNMNPPIWRGVWFPQAALA